MTAIPMNVFTSQKQRFNFFWQLVSNLQIRNVSLDLRHISCKRAYICRSMIMRRNLYCTSYATNKISVDLNTCGHRRNCVRTFKTMDDLYIKIVYSLLYTSKNLHMTSVLYYDNDISLGT